MVEIRRWKLKQAVLHKICNPTRNCSAFSPASFPVHIPVSCPGYSCLPQCPVKIKDIPVTPMELLGRKHLISSLTHSKSAFHQILVRPHVKYLKLPGSSLLVSTLWAYIALLSSSKGAMKIISQNAPVRETV